MFLQPFCIREIPLEEYHHFWSLTAAQEMQQNWIRFVLLFLTLDMTILMIRFVSGYEHYHLHSLNKHISTHI